MHVKTDYGWEHSFKISYADPGFTPGPFVLGIYDDTIDDIQPTDDIEAITAEPNGAAYARQNAQPSGTVVSFQAGRTQVVFADTTYDVSDSTNTVQSAFVADTFQADGDSSPQLHLLETGALGDSIDLSARSGTFTVSGFGFVDAV